MKTKMRTDRLAELLMYLLLLSFVSTNRILQVAWGILQLVTLILLLHRVIRSITERGIRFFWRSGGSGSGLTWIFFLAMCLLLALEKPGHGTWTVAVPAFLLFLSLPFFLYRLKKGR